MARRRKLNATQRLLAVVVLEAVRRRGPYSLFLTARQIGWDFIRFGGDHRANVPMRLKYLCNWGILRKKIPPRCRVSVYFLGPRIGEYKDQLDYEPKEVGREC